MKTIKYAFAFCLMLMTSGYFAQGLQGIVVEKYYSTDAADAAEATTNGAVVPLTQGSTVYRIYVDMADGYKFSQLFGSPTHPLSISSTANFYNDPSYGVSINPATISATNIRRETAMIDSYLTVGGTYNGAVGVLKSEDANGTVGHQTGLLANDAGDCFGLPITGAGAQDGMTAASGSTFVTPNALGLDDILDALDQTAGNSVVINNGALAALGGIVGPTASNLVLIGQFTTFGELSFELNIQIVNIATGDAENYVASDPTGSEQTHASLTYGANVAPAVSLTSPANGAGFTVGANVTISANASDANGTITGVEFFVDGISVGVDNDAPYSASYTAVLGNHVITAVATDNDCVSTTSSSRNISVTNAPVSGPANDNRASASLVAGNSYPTCSGSNGNLANATESAEATSSEPVGAGQDVWYRFVAQTNGIRIQATNTSGLNDLVIELQNNDGSVTLAVENENTSGNEILVANNLTPGSTYYAAIRNFNTTTRGAFSVCIQHVAASSPNNGSSFNSLCGYIKSTWTGADLYSVTFDDGVNPAISASHTSTQIPFTWMPGLLYNTAYNVTFTTTYYINDAAGNQTTVVVNSAPHVVTILPHEPVELRAADRCPATRTIGSFIGTTDVICGASDWEWELELVDESGNPIGIEGPVYIETNSTSRYLRTSLIPGIAPGNRYRVRVRPLFANGPGLFAPGYQYLCIAGSAGLAENQETLQSVVAERQSGNPADSFFTLYPNPNRGEFFIINASGLSAEQVFVRILDVAGREVYVNGFSEDGMLNASIQTDKILQAGLYMVELTDGSKKLMQRMIVE